MEGREVGGVAEKVLGIRARDELKRKFLCDLGGVAREREGGMGGYVMARAVTRRRVRMGELRLR